MSSDADYAAFLDKANQDTDSPSASTKQQSSGGGRKKTIATTVNSEVPAPLQELEAYYISDADEPFEPVSLKWDGGALDEGQ